MVKENKDYSFDVVMQIVGENGKFQQIFVYYYNIALVVYASMCYMNSALVLNEPEHTCHVPGREIYNLAINQWHSLTIPNETNSYGTLSRSSCKMYNTSLVAHLPINQWKFTENDTISCVYGYDYDKTWYERTVVSDNDWVCDKELYQTNIFVLHQMGDSLGLFFIGQLSDKIGRRPVFYLSLVIIIIGRIMSTLSTANYLVYATTSLISTLTVTLVYSSPLIIALEMSREEDHGKIVMLQCIGWTTGMSLMPLIFWVVRDWVWFLMLTTLPIGLFALWNKYMIESPRWLATKGRYDKCAVELNRIAKVNGKDVVITEKILKKLMTEEESEIVYGILSLLTHWRLAKNTIMLFICWSNYSVAYAWLMLNSTRMGGNPFLNFLYQNAIELPSYVFSKYLADRIGRRNLNAATTLFIFLTCISVIFLARGDNTENLLICFAIFMKFLVTCLFFSVNLQALEIFPTCLRQSGMSVITIGGCLFATLGPFIMYLGKEYDVRYPYLTIGGLAFVGFFAAMSLPETLNNKLPSTLNKAKKYGKDQKFWYMPKKYVDKIEKEMQLTFILSETNKV